MATSIYAKPIKAKTILKFTLPTVLMMVFMSLYTVVDGIVVANCVGSDALSAINIVYPFTLVFMAVGLMFSTGSNAIIAKKWEKANRRKQTDLCPVLQSRQRSFLLSLLCCSQFLPNLCT